MLGSQNRVVQSILLPNQGWSLSSIEHLMVLVNIHLNFILLHYAQIMWYILYASMWHNMELSNMLP